MLYYHLFFPPLMILSPLIVLLVYKPDEEADPILVSETRKRLLVGTGAAIAVFATFAAARILFRSDAIESSLQGSITQLMSFLFFPLWFLLAMPYMRAARPYMNQATGAASGQAPEVRSAQLVSRRNLRVLPRWTHWVPGTLLAIGLGLCIWQGLGSGDVKPSLQVLVAALLFLALMCVPLFPSLQAAALSTPEPMPRQPLTGTGGGLRTPAQGEGLGLVGIGGGLAALAGRTRALIHQRRLPGPGRIHLRPDRRYRRQRDRHLRGRVWLLGRLLRQQGA